jgi:hypothetical protein
VAELLDDVLGDLLLLVVRERNAPFFEAGLPSPTVQIESNSAFFSKALVSQADLLAYLSNDLITQEINQRRTVSPNVKGVTLAP